MMKNTEIKTYWRNRFLLYILFIGVFSFISITLHGADAPKTAIGKLKDANPGQTVTVPVTVTGFTNIGSFYLYIEYDYSKIHYTSVTKNPVLTGNFNINDIDLGDGIHRIILSWSGGIYGINLADGSSMVDFVFNYIAGSAELKWNTANDNYCAFTDSRVNRLNDSPKPTYYVNGEVSSFMPSAPKVGTIIQPTYELQTGSVELTGLPSGTWIINPGSVAGTGPAHTISGLAPGTYNFTVTNAENYTSAQSADVVINPHLITSVDNIPLIDNNGNQGLWISNYPNPFCINTTIEYSIPVEGKVVIKLYNHMGQQVASLVDAIQCAGKYAVNCSFNSLQPGLYIARITLAGKAWNRTGTIKLSVHG
jgi:hypothetical protein